MAENLSTFVDAMKTVYVGVIEELKNNDTRIWKWIPKRPADGGGVTIGSTGPYPSGVMPPRTCNFAVHLGRNATGTFQDPEGKWASAGTQRYRQGLKQGRTGYWSAQVSMAAINRTKGSAAAYARVLTEAATRTGNDFMNENERILMGDGSGTLGVVSGTPSVAANQITVVLDNFQDGRKFARDQFINGWTARTAGATQRTIVSAGTAATNCVKVVNVSVSGSTATIILGAIDGGTITATNLAQGDVFTKGNDNINTTSRVGARDASVRYEPMGLTGLAFDCDTPMENGTTIGGLFGINATTQFAGPHTATPGSANTGGELDWQAFNSRSSIARTINNFIMQSMLDMPEISSGELPDLFVTTFGLRTEFVNTLLGVRRTVNTTEVTGNTGGGFRENAESRKFPEYADRPVIPSRYAPSYRMTPGDVTTQLAATCLSLNSHYLEISEWHDLRFMEHDGLMWRMFERSPFIEGTLEHTWECVTNKRNAHAAAHALLASDFASS